MNSGRIWVLVGLCCLSSLLAGCGTAPQGPPLYSVTGTVVLEGKPVEGATVAFRCDQAPRVATGTTDASGKFELTTFQPGDGAVAGTHKVTVSKVHVENAAGEELSMEEAAAKPAVGAAKHESLLPDKYADPAKSPLEFTVTKEGPNQFAIELEP